MINDTQRAPATQNKLDNNIDRLRFQEALCQSKRWTHIEGLDDRRLSDNFINKF
jgi:hypothetical protein